MADHEKTYKIDGHRHVRKSFLFSIEDDSSSSDSGEEIIPNTPKQTNGSVQASCTTPPYYQICHQTSNVHFFLKCIHFLFLSFFFF